MSDVLTTNWPFNSGTMRRVYGRMRPNATNVIDRDTGGMGVTATLNSSTVFLGSSVNSVPAMQGRFYEVLLYNGDIGFTQLAALESYLRTKYVKWDNPVFSSIAIIEGRLHPFRPLATVPGRIATPYDLRGMNYAGANVNTTAIRLWLDASDSSTITTTAGKVTQWRDKSGWANHVSPVGIYSNATVQSAYQNGLDVLNFTGNNMYATANGAAFYPYECFVVLALKSLVRTDIIGVGSTSSDNYNSLTFSDSTALRWQNGSTTNSRTPATIAPANETSTSFLILGWSLRDNKFRLFRNGAALSSTASYTFTLTAASRIQIGARQTFSSVPDIQCNMYLAEILMFDGELPANDRRQVEYYLANKWGLLSSLTWPSRITQARYPYFNPKLLLFATQSIPMTLWLDAADPSSVTIVSGRVRVWADKARFQVALVELFQNTVANRPTYVNNGIVFNGTSTFLTSTVTSSTYLNGQTAAVTVFAVVTNCIGQSTATNNSIFGVSSASTNSWGLRLGTSTTQTAGFLGTQPATTLPGSFVLVGNLSSSGTTFRINGTQAATAAGAVTLTGGTSPFVVGRGATGSAGYISGSVHEVILFAGSLNIAMVQHIEGYLAWKWGLARRLPSTHPYYKYAAGP
jgi:hypothetical protein